MDLAYVAHSESCALLLDSEGVCRWIVPKGLDSTVETSPRVTRELATAKRCVGAQFVATLDRDVEGLLGHEPAAGKTLLFASVTDGRVALLRFGPILAFDEVGSDEEQPTTAVEPRATLVSEIPTPTRRAEDGVLDALANQRSTPPVEPIDASVESAALSPQTSQAPNTIEEKDPPALLAPPPPPGRSRETLRGVAPPTNLDSSSQDAYEVMKQFYIAQATDESELNLQTGSFSYDPTGASSAIASFLKDVAALAETPYSKALDTNDIEDLHTGSFGSLSAPLGRATLTNAERSPLPAPSLPTRLETPPPPPLETRESLDDAPRIAMNAAADSEIDIATGSFSRVSDARLESLASVLESDDDDDDIPVSLRRPSGFVRRADDVLSFNTQRDPRRSNAETRERAFDFDADETLRFARVEGGGITHH